MHLKLEIKLHYQYWLNLVDFHLVGPLILFLFKHRFTIFWRQLPLYDTIWYYMILYDDTINYMILFDDVPVSNDLCFLCWKLLEEMTVTSENPTMRGLIRYWRCMTVMMKTWNMKTMITGEDQRQYFDNILTNIAPSATHLNTLLWNIPSAHSSPGLTI